MVIVMKAIIKKYLSPILILISFASVVWGAQSYLYTNYATAEDVKRIEKRLDVKILEDRMSNIQDRIWKIEDRYFEQRMPKEATEQLRLLSTEKDKLKKDLNILNENK